MNTISIVMLLLFVQLFLYLSKDNKEPKDGAIGIAFFAGAGATDNCF